MISFSLLRYLNGTRCRYCTKKLPPPSLPNRSGVPSNYKEQPRNAGERAFKAKERVVDWQMVQSKKGRTKLVAPEESSTAISEPETTNESHLERSSIWKKRNRLPPSDVLMLIAEEQISEAMQRGFFENLKGVGKPLTPEDLSPPGKGDITERLINRMITNQGFVPEWIESEKEIASDINELRRILFDRFSEVIVAADPIVNTIIVDEQLKQRLEARVLDINRSIDRLNLIVPMLRFQRAHVSLERELIRLKTLVSNNARKL